jgi:hypothetical protein
MQTRDAEPPVIPTAHADTRVAEASLEETITQLREILGPAEEIARGILEASVSVDHNHDHLAVVDLTQQP